MVDHGGDRRPLYTVVAGPNGSGKSTLTSLLQGGGQLGPCLNPDVIAASLPPGTDARDRIARQITVAETERRFAAGESFGRESAFSGQTIMRSMVQAKEAGFRVEVIFVAVDNVEEAIGRVAARVERGGHGIPADEQRRRFGLTVANAAAAARTADRVFLFENPRDLNFRLIAQVDGGNVTTLEDRRPPWVDHVIAGLDRSMPQAAGGSRPTEPRQDRSDDLER